jgi:hypothetical protein
MAGEAAEATPSIPTTDSAKPAMQNQGQLPPGDAQAEAPGGSYRFEPRFFLWPVNVVRPVVGVTGIVYSMASHFAHISSEAVVGIASWCAMFPVSLGVEVSVNMLWDFDPHLHWDWERRWEGYTVECYHLLSYVVETPFALLDLPQELAGDTEPYPYSRTAPSGTSDTFWPDPAWIRGQMAWWDRCGRLVVEYPSYPGFFVVRNTCPQDDAQRTK